MQVIYMYTRPKQSSNNSIYFAEIASAIGHRLRSINKLSTDSSLATKAGAFILYTFQEAGLISVKLGQGKRHATYVVTVENDDGICKLWEDTVVTKTEKLPATGPYAPWTTFRHPAGINIVKTRDTKVLEQITPERTPIVYECLNRAQAVGWRINEDIFSIVGVTLGIYFVGNGDLQGESGRLGADA